MTTALMTACPPRFGTPRSPERATLGPLVGEVARLLGKPFMPWQQHVADICMEIDPITGLLAYNEFGLTVPRQSGKSTFILAKAVHRATATKFFGNRQRLVYTAQTRNKAREKWEEDYAADLAASPVFGPKILTHFGNGNEHIRFPNRSRFGIEANTEKAGHGGTLDEAYLDEAFAQTDGRLEQAFRPAMITRRNTQLGVVSTAGWSDGSYYLQSKVARGRAAIAKGRRSGLCYFEWSAPDDAPYEDRDVWRACMPALGYTITEEAIADELEAMRDNIADFRRAYLNQWVPRSSGEPTVIDMALWDTFADPDSDVDGRAWFGISMADDRNSAAIGAAGRRADGFTHVEVIEHLSGVRWVADKALELQRAWGAPVVLDPGSPAGALIPALQEAGVDLTLITTRQLGQACGAFYDDTVAGHLRHLGDPILTDALLSAKKQPMGDAWKFSLKQSAGDVCPLLAVTLAKYGLDSDAGNDPANNVW